jgi:hypothetical protein
MHAAPAARHGVLHSTDGGCFAGFWFLVSVPMAETRPALRHANDVDLVMIMAASHQIM